MATSKAVESYEKFSNVGAKTLDKLLRSPDFTQSLTSAQYEGMQSRVATARWSQEARIVFDAIEDGYSLDAMPVATGLTDSQISDAIKFLNKGEYIKIIPVTKL